MQQRHTHRHDLSLSLFSGGCGRTGTYIAVSILIERLKTEGVVDVFHTVRNLRLQRPGMVQSEVWAINTNAIIVMMIVFRLSCNFVTKQHWSIWNHLNSMTISSSFLIKRLSIF